MNALNSIARFIRGEPSSSSSSSKTPVPLSLSEGKALELMRQIFDLRGTQSGEGELDIKRRELTALSAEISHVSGNEMVTSLATRVLEISNDTQVWVQDQAPVPALRPSAASETKESLRMFAQLHSDHLLENSGLEGAPMSLPIKYIAKVLPRVSEGILDPATREAIRYQLQASLNLVNELDKGEGVIRDLAATGTGQPSSSQALNRDRTSLEPALVKQYENIQKHCVELRERFDRDGVVLLPAGWSAPPTSAGGHSILCEATRQSDGNITFRVFHRGAGIEYHAAPSREGGKDYFPSHLEIRNVSPDKLFNPDFLQLLWEPKITGSATVLVPEKQSFDEHDLFDVILPKLGGKIILSPERTSLEDMASTHQSGTCGWHAVAAYLKNKMSFNAYKLLIFTIKRDSLFAFYQQQREKILANSVHCHLFESALQSHAFRLDKLHQGGLIDERTYQEHAQDLFLLKQAFESAKKLHLLKLHEQAPKISLEPHIPQPLIAPKGPAFYRNYSPSIRDLSYVPPLPFVLPTIDTWSPKPAFLETHLRFFVEQLEKITDAKSVWASYQAILSKLPLPETDEGNSFWNAVLWDSEEAKDVMLSLARMQGIAMEYSLESDIVERPTDTLLPMYKGAAINHHLITHTDPDIMQLNEMAALPSYITLKGLYAPFEKTLRTMAQFDFPQHAAELRDIYAYFVRHSKDQNDDAEAPFSWYEISEQSLEEQSMILEVDLSEDTIAPEVRYLKDRLDSDSAFYDTVRNAYHASEQYEKSGILFDLLDTEGKLAYLMNRTDQELESFGIPPTYTAWRRQGWQLQAYAQNSGMNGDITFKATQWSDGTTQHATFSVDCISEKYTKRRLAFSQAFASPHNREEIHTALMKELPTADKSDLQHHQVASMTIAANRGVTGQRQRELSLIVANEDMQIEQALAFFTRNIDTLEHADYRAFLSTTLFDSDLLMRHLQRHPRLLFHLRGFVEKAYRIHRERDDVMAVEFLLGVSKRIEENYKVANSSGTSDFERSPGHIPPFDVAEALSELLSVPSWEPEERSVLFRRYIANLEEQDDIYPEEVGSILEGLKHLQQHPIITPDRHDLQTQRQMERSLAKAAPYISQILQDRTLVSPIGRRLLNQLCALPGEKVKKRSWQCSSFPLFQSTDGNIEINVLTGEMRHAEMYTNELPKSVLESKYYGMLFGSKTFPTQLIRREDGGDIYEFQDSSKATYRVYSHGEYRIDRNINGQWCTFNIESGTTGGPLRNKTTSQWVSPNNERCYSISAIDGIMYEIPIKKPTVDGASSSEYRIKVLDSKGKHTGLFLDNGSPNEAKLKPLACYSYVLCDADNKPFQLRLEYGYATAAGSIFGNRDLKAFNFVIKDVDGRRRWECQEMPGYYLHDDPFVGELETLGIKDYLRLVTAKGEERVLLPHFVVKKGGDRQWGFPLDDNPLGMISYDINSKASRNISQWKGTPEAMFYLAFRAMGSMREDGYRLARELLNEATLSVYQGKPEELKMLETIARLQRINHDHDPRAAALRLQAGLLAREMERRAARAGEPLVAEEETDDQFQKRFSEDLNTYAASIRHSPSFRLSPADEQELLSIANKHKAFLYPKTWELLGSPQSPQVHGIMFPDCPPTENTKLILSALLSASPDDLVNGKPLLRCRLTDKEAAAVFMRYAHEPDHPALQDILECTKYVRSPLWQALRLTLIKMRSHPRQYPPIDPGSPPDTSILMSAIKTHFTPIITDYQRPISFPIGYTRRPTSGMSAKVRAKVTPATAEPSYFIGQTRPATPSALPPPPDTNFNLADYYLKDDGRPRKPDLTMTHASGMTHTMLEFRLPEEEMVEKEAGQLLEGCQSLIRARKKQAPPPRIDPTKLLELEEGLSGLIAGQTRLLLEKQEELYALLEARAGRNILEPIKGVHEPLTIDDVCLLLATERLEHPQIRQCAIEYLQQATELQKHQRTLDLIAETLNVPPHQREGLLERIQQTESATRIYDPDQHPEILVLEYLSDLLVRQDQYDNLLLLLQGKEANNPIIQAIMGSGKTSVLMTLIALKRCNGDNLSVLMLPPELMESMSEEVRQRLGSHWRQKVHPLIFTRNSDTSIEELRRIHALLKRVETDRHCLLMAPKTLHCLHLKFRELLASAGQAGSKASPELLQRISLMRDILIEFKSRGSVLLDEVDLQLTCRSEVNFPLGNPQNLDTSECEVIVELYSLLTNNPEIAEVLKVDFIKKTLWGPSTSSSRSKEAMLFIQSTYNSNVKPILANGLMTRLAEMPFDSPPVQMAVNSFFQVINRDPSRKAIIMDYLMWTDDLERRHAACDFVASIDNEHLRNILGLAMQELNGFLPETLPMKSGDRYNIDSKSGQVIASPHLNGDPVKGASFNNPHETANFSIQSLSVNGIPSDFCAKVLLRLKNDAITESQSGIDITQTRAHREYAKICGDPRKYPLRRINRKLATEVAKDINASPELRNRFIALYVLPGITSHPQKLNSNAQNLIDYFNEAVGFGGNLWNAKTYNPTLKSHSRPEVDAQTLLTLMRKTVTVNSEGKIEPVNNVTELKDDSPEVLERFVLRRLEQGHPVRTVLDSGGTLNDADVSQLSQAWGAKISEYGLDGIAYHTTSNNLVMRESKLDTSHGESAVGDEISFARSCLNPDKRFCIYRQPFTTGTSIEQSYNAEAVVTIGRNILFRDLLQTVWRMRGIEREQRVHFVVSSDVARLIRRTLDLPDDHIITDSDIIRFALVNQCRQLQEELYMSSQHQIRGIAQAAVNDILLDPKISIADLIKIFNGPVLELFQEGSPMGAFERYGRFDSKSPVETVQECVSRHVDLLNTIRDSYPFLYSLDVEGITTRLQAIDTSDLPRHGISRRRADRDRAVESLQVQQSQKQAVTVRQTHQLQAGIVVDAAPVEWQYHTWPDGIAAIYKATEGPLPKASPSPSGLFSRLSDALSTSISTLSEWYHPEDEGEPPISHSLLDYLQPNPTAASLFAPLGSSVMTTSNWSGKIGKVSTLQPFDQREKPGDSVLVQYRPDGTFRIVVGDNLDIETFTKTLADDKQNGAPNDDGTVHVIYNLAFGVTQIGATRQSDGDLEIALQRDTAFQTTILQLKFFLGYPTFTPDEERLLKTWIRQVDPQTAEAAYRQTVIQRSQQPDLLWSKVKHLFAE